MVQFVEGAVTMACCVAGLLFLRFWRRNHDRLFLMFGIAFCFGASEIVYQLKLHGSAEAYFAQMSLGTLIYFTHGHLFGFTTSFFLALVIATFMRRISERNPILFSLLLRVILMYTISRSCPWKPVAARSREISRRRPVLSLLPSL